jgi:hypothetical protein
VSLFDDLLEAVGDQLGGLAPNLIGGALDQLADRTDGAVGKILVQQLARAVREHGPEALDASLSAFADHLERDDVVGAIYALWEAGDADALTAMTEALQEEGAVRVVQQTAAAAKVATQLRDLAGFLRLVVGKMISR